MSTPMELEAAGELIKLEGELDHRQQEERCIYAFPKVIEWIEVRLCNESPVDSFEISPIEQLDQLLYEFCSGEELIFDRQIHPLHHIDAGVWELKKPDIRLFGWFYSKDVFICSAGDTMERTKIFGLYAGYRDEAVRLRDAIRLDAPKFIAGENPDNVISNWHYP